MDPNICSGLATSRCMISKDQRTLPLLNMIAGRQGEGARCRARACCEQLLDSCRGAACCDIPHRAQHGSQERASSVRLRGRCLLHRIQQMRYKGGNNPERNHPVQVCLFARCDVYKHPTDLCQQLTATATTAATFAAGAVVCWDTAGAGAGANTIGWGCARG